MSVAVRKWLAEYKTLQEGQLSHYANSHCPNEDLIQELYDVFEDDLSSEIIDPVCHQLFDFYRSPDVPLQRFTRELVPTLIWTYLFALMYSDKKKCGGIEACLLGIYNLEVVDETGKAKQRTVTIPSLATPSLFHEPPSLASLVLTESALTRYHGDVARSICIGPLPQVESLNAYNRLPILTYILNRYTADIVNLSSRSHSMLCKMCSRLTKIGFEDIGRTNHSASDFNDSISSETQPCRGVSFVEDLRIPLSSGFLVELLSAVYYVIRDVEIYDKAKTKTFLLLLKKLIPVHCCVLLYCLRLLPIALSFPFNGQERDGRQALEDIHWRASYELYADVLLVTNAVRNSLQVDLSEQPKDVPMGISIALSPTQGNPAFSKDAITNASFRARKLPEDIDVQDSVDGSALPTDAINEESADNDTTTDGQRLAVSSVNESKLSPLQHKSVSTAKGPLKSIMKKREERAREKIQRKESDMASTNGAGGPSTAATTSQKRGSHFKEFLELHVSKSPRHSVSMSGMAAVADTSGHAIDPAGVQLNIIRSGSGMNRQSLDSESLTTARVSRSSVAALGETNGTVAGSWTDNQDVTTSDDDNDDNDVELDQVINKTQL